jgi:hypothetical protein
MCPECGDVCVLFPACRYTAAEALQALNKVYVMMMEAVGGTDLRPMVVRLGAGD